MHLGYYQVLHSNRDSRALGGVKTKARKNEKDKRVLANNKLLLPGSYQLEVPTLTSAHPTCTVALLIIYVVYVDAGLEEGASGTGIPRPWQSYHHGVTRRSKVCHQKSEFEF